MKAVFKIAGTHICALAMGITLVGVCGELMLTESSFNSAAAQTQAADNDNTDSVGQTTDWSPSIMPAAAQTQEDTAEDLTFISYRKAAFGEYDMTAAQSKQSDEEEAEVGDFTVEMPQDSTTVYEPVRNDPLNLTDTRSIAEEYYTVYDENSGKTLTLNGEELLLQMVNNEIGGTWGEEAIKAQIVAAYSYIRFNESIGLTPTVGLKSGYSSRLKKCLAAVEGQTVMYNGKIINAVYSASTAGYSTTAKDIWGVSYPYLQCVKSEYDENDPNWGYTRTYSRDEVREILEDELDIELSDDVQSWFTIDRIFSVRYVGKVTIDGRSDCTLTGKALCNLFGLKSNAIEIEYKDGSFIFTSCGWGHGVGMSQWGAYYYAKNGWTYDQILTHYYLNTTLAVSTVSTSAVSRGEQLNSAEAENEADDKSETSTTTTAAAAVSEDDVSQTTTTTQQATTTTKQTETQQATVSEEQTVTALPEQPQEQ